MLIVITGSPGTGKTTVTRELGKMLRARTIYLREFVKEKGLASGFDGKMKSDIVDAAALGRELRKELRNWKGGREAAEGINSNIIVEGHLACEFPLDAKYVFVLRCSPATLEKRLRARKYSEEKVRENMLSEMLDYCVQRSGANYPKAEICEIETARSTAAQTASRMFKMISSNNVKSDEVDYGNALRKFLGLNARRK